MIAANVTDLRLVWFVFGTIATPTTPSIVTPGAIREVNALAGNIPHPFSVPHVLSNALLGLHYLRTVQQTL
jgi:hypothetical protein